jgi:hypothetical protein
MAGPGEPVRERMTAPCDGHHRATEMSFHLLAELGRGTFGRVYLVQQGELTDRLSACPA